MVRAVVCKIYSIHNIRLHERLINAIQYMTKGDLKEWDKTAPVSFFMSQHLQLDKSSIYIDYSKKNSRSLAT